MDAVAVWWDRRRWVTGSKRQGREREKYRQRQTGRQTGCGGWRVVGVVEGVEVVGGGGGGARGRKIKGSVIRRTNERKDETYFARAVE